LCRTDGAGHQPPVPGASQRLWQGLGVHQHTTGPGTRDTQLFGVEAILQATGDQDVELDADGHQQRHREGVLRSVHHTRGRGSVVGGRVGTVHRRQHRGTDVRVHHCQDVQRSEKGRPVLVREFRSAKLVHARYIIII